MEGGGVAEMQDTLQKQTVPQCDDFSTTLQLDFPHFTFLLTTPTHDC